MEIMRLVDDEGDRPAMLAHQLAQLALALAFRRARGPHAEIDARFHLLGMHWGACGLPHGLRDRFIHRWHNAVTPSAALTRQTGATPCAMHPSFPLRFAEQFPPPRRYCRDRPG